MISTSRNCRDTQHEMLAQACQHRQRARIVPADDDHQRLVANTRFLEIRDNGLYVEQPIVTLSNGPVRGCAVDVYFEHDGQRFAFRTHVIGPDTWRDARLELAVWKLELPEKVERKQQRDHYRVSLLDLGEIPVTFARVDDADDTFEATLLNISAGGISARAALSLADRINSHAPYWTQFHLPHEPTRFAFVIRVMHMRPNKQQKIVLLGCRFCQMDDPRLHQAQLRRFERYIAGRQRARLSRVTQHGDAGGK